MAPAAQSHRFETAGAPRRAVRLLVTRGPAAALSARLLPHLDRAGFRLTRGRFTPSAWVTGLPVVRLVTTGARSGRRRTARVLAIPVADGYLVVAANFGATTHPNWYLNLRAHPRATLVLADGTTLEVDAEELHGPARERGFEHALALNPGWRRFRRRAGSRAIPVLRLEPRPQPR